MISLTTIDNRSAIRAQEDNELGPITEALAADLRRRLKGEVRFDTGSRALYATDASNYRQVPIGVVIPRTVADVVETVAVCRRHNAPVLARGGGTSLAGQCCNVAVVMDMTKYLNRVLEIDARNRRARVEPGCVLDDLRHAAQQHGLNFGPDPATHTHNTLGGMLGNDSCGIHSLLCAKHGLGLRTADNTDELEILTYDGVRMRVGETPPAKLESLIRRGGREGEIYAKLKAFADKYADLIRARFPKDVPRRVSGYNFPQLLPENNFNLARALVGSEGTLVTILEATLLLVPNPKARTLVVVGYQDVFQAAEHIMEILPLKPTGLEGMDHLLFEWTKQRGGKEKNLALMPQGKGFLFIEFGGDSKADADAQARQCMEILGRNGDVVDMELMDDPEREHMLWKVRESGLGSTAWVEGQPDSWPGWEDSAVAPAKIAPYLRELRKLFDKFGYTPSLYGHFGQGCIHCRVGFDLVQADGIKKFREFMQEAAYLVVRFGGSLSGEHGDGQARAELLPIMFGDEMVQAFVEFKRIWDPLNRMNPHKVVEPYGMDQNLRLGTEYDPPPVETHFQYPQDHYTFHRAALRCVGVGECRKKDSGTMCPSYMVTRDENDSTRGRAHLLFEMMRGDPVTEGWKSEAVKGALDLCLACKGCKGECPVNVDMATYKAEFLSHYYEHRLRPRHAYSMGLIHVWADIASRMPRLVNFVSHAPILGDLFKWAGGIHHKRSVPSFATETFKDWFRKRGPRNDGKPAVILWPDTFNNFFHPWVAQAAVEVLEDAGCQVLVPVKDLCCGRPLYDFGFVDMAGRWLRDILDTLRPWIRAGVPVVALEPSCWSVFHEELPGLFPHDEDAKRLHEQAFLLGQFLHQRVEDYEPPKLRRKAVIHGHCHHKSLVKMDAEKAILDKLGLDYELLDSGCCGMAGSFGFEDVQEHYDVSLAVGERVLLPAVRQAQRDTLIVTDGFSCKEQISQCTNRQGLHLAEVLQMALRERTASGRPEERHSRKAKAGLSTATVLGAGALALGGYVLWQSLQNGNGREARRRAVRVAD
jgi:FAD/FMN-containing dehydrogenase/Fe-S oxidoreductase